MKRPGADAGVVAGDSDFAVGDVRFSFLVIRHDARTVARPRATVWLARSQSGKPFERATAGSSRLGDAGGALAGRASLADVPPKRVKSVRKELRGQFSGESASTFGGLTPPLP
jgi:hypothetical protein